MKPTIETMKLAVASMLIDCLGTEDGELNTLHWLDTKARVTDREWLYICWMAEDRLDATYGDLYCETLEDVCGCDVECGKASRVCYFAEAEERLESICRIIMPSIFTNENIPTLPVRLP